MNGEPDEPPDIVSRLEAGEWDDRIAALREIVARGPIPAELYTRTVALLDAPGLEHRESVVAVLGDIGRPVVPVLCHALATSPAEDGGFRRAVIVALAAIGPAAAEAIPLLRDLQADEWLGPPAARALERIAGTRSGSGLTSAVAFTVCAVLLGVAVASARAGPALPGPGAAVLLVVGVALAVGVLAVRERSPLVTLVAIACVGGGIAFGAVNGIGTVFGTVATVLDPKGR
jgi:hypothetical protein